MGGRGMKTPSPYLFLSLFITVMADLQYNCNENKMHALYYATRCCDVTKPEHNPEFKKCHKKFSSMAAKPKNKLTSPERIAINICAYECSFEAMEFIRKDYPSELNEDAIDEYFEEKYPELQDYSVYITSVFHKCIQFDGTGQVNIKFPKVEFIEKRCNSLAARIMMCVQIRAMQTCPKTQFDTESMNCAASKLYFNECVGSIEKVLRNL